MPLEAQPKTGGPVSPQQKNTIALMAVQGLPHSIIASAVRRSPATIKRLVKEDPYVQERMTEYENRIISAAALHRFDMMGKLDTARRVIDDGLSAPDLKVRLDTAKWTIEHVVPKQTERLDINMDVSGQIEVAQLLPAIARSIEVLQESKVGNGSFQRHVRKNLPGPMSLEQGTPTEE